MSNKGNSSPAQVSGWQASAQSVGADQNRISFDWLPELKDGYIIFPVRLQRGNRENAFDIGIDPKRLKHSDHQLLQAILTRRQNELSKAEEVYSNVNWLLEVALSQQGLGKEERADTIDALLLRSSVSYSYKKRYFRERGKKFLAQAGIDTKDESTTNSAYNEVYCSWQTALRRLNVGTPRLKTDDGQEQEELELFFLGLRHHDSFVDSCNQHKALVDKWTANQDFLDAVADTIKKRLIPDQTECSLEYHIIRCWLHEDFWLISHEDRALILSRVYELTNVTGDTVRKAVKKLGLKGWNDFLPRGNSRAPYRVELTNDAETKQLVYQFVLQSSGQNG